MLREIRQAGSLAQAILVTASESITIAGEALRLGAADYIRKPIDFEAAQGAPPWRSVAP